MQYRKFNHYKVLDIAIKAILISITLYGFLGLIYFSATRGIQDFGIYM